MMILEDLQLYLGYDDYQPQKLVWTYEHADALTRGHKDFATYAKRDKEALYVLAQLERDEWWRPHLAFAREVLNPLLVAGGERLRVLESPAGIGSFGLALVNQHDVAFADYQSQSLKFLRWRLKRHSVKAAVYELNKDEVPVHEIVVSFWAAQRYEPEEQWDYIQRVAGMGALAILDLDTRWGGLDPFRWVDHAGLLEKIRDRYDVIRYINVNHHVHLVAFWTGNEVGAEPAGEMASAPDAENDLEES